MQRNRAFLAILLVAGASGTAASVPTHHDDAYHYALFRDGLHDWNYVEWWYFNLIDESSGLHLAFTYSVLDPENLTGFGSAGVLAVAYTPEGDFHESRFLPAVQFHGSPTSADLSIGGSGSIEVIDDASYRLQGAVAGAHSIAWDLTYVSRSSPFLGIDGEKVGLSPWEKMSWLVFMPRALVSGEVNIDGKSYVLTDASGYHDHNWGEWSLANVIWNWGQYSGPELDLELGDFRRRAAGVVSFDRGGERTVFEKDQYRVVHTRWNRDGDTRGWFPTETWLFAENERFALVAAIRADETQALLPPPGIPFLLVKPLLFEQIATYRGSLWERDGAGRWQLLHLFSGPGFKEFATRTSAQTGQLVEETVP